ncbi:hypothetical protein AOCH_000982 [Aspergillus ochraceoroseus]|uniref:Uncharacterized protein n=1 Tax=Aspergillus ochraceoroseus TaxID=138278 RepID=A0A0F8V2H6_9EURO|nr:hypothetical protein AOCH_000982 [Aspergillus ochraceoroseus]
MTAKSVRCSDPILTPNLTPPREIDPNENLDILNDDKSMPIAIVGLGFRGPGDATNVEKLWTMIRERREAWSKIPKSRWNNDAFYHPDHARHGTINVEGGHFLQEDVSLFDAPFFNMTGDEAAAMDPQQRLLLEVTYEGLENGVLPISSKDTNSSRLAGIELPSIMGSNTSCFVGSFNADYTDLLLRDPDCIPMYQCTNSGQSRAMIANRISYFFDLKGPSVTVDTACSGSLVALHLACQSLRTSDASMAIAAGVNLILSHEFMSTMTMMNFLSPNGRCCTFDQNADGYARGEAIGCLILKPLRNAIRDNDPIRAIIRGSGSNQDGRTAGITLPNGVSQEALIRRVYNTAGLDPLDTEYVEAHGTGTQAGDPIETGALAKVFSPGRSPEQPLRVGSIKTNVGHLEGTSGIAGVIKAVLMLERRVFLPNVNFQTLNPRIMAKEWSLKVQLEDEPWETLGPHRISVNSFGYGGSNAHVVLEETLGYMRERKLIRTHDLTAATSDESQSRPGRSRIFMLSGFDETSLKHQIQRLRDFLQEQTVAQNDSWMNNMAYTLNERYTKHLYRAAVVCNSIDSFKDTLSTQLKIYKAPRKPNVGFVFTGQGAQWPGMGKELLETYPVFQKSIQKIDVYMSQIGASFHIIDEILKTKQISRLSHPLLSQPICSALQIALVDLLSSWGICPDSVAGHSSGEIAAAYAAGILSMEDAVTVAYFRGVAASRLTENDEKPKGGMLAVGLSAAEVQPYIKTLQSGRVVVACINSPSSVTISGDEAAIAELETILRDKELFARRLAVEVAYHSHHMELIGGEYLESISHIKPRVREHKDARDAKESVSFFSSVTGSEIDASELGPQYWVRNLLGQVKFVDSIQTLCFETGSRSTHGMSEKKRAKRSSATNKATVDSLVEIGPHSALAGPIRDILISDIKLERANISYGSVLIRGADAVSTSLALAASLGCIGYPIKFQVINNPVSCLTPQVRVDIPPYAWNHSRSYWAEPRVSRAFRNRKFPRTDLLGVPDRLSCVFEPRWKNFIRVSEIPWLTDHKIQSNIVYPAAGYIAMAIEAAAQLASENEEYRIASTFCLRDVSIRSALVINEASAAEVMISLRHRTNEHNSADQSYEFAVYSVTIDHRWTEHCSGYLEIQRSPFALEEINCSGLESDSTFSVLDVQQFYENLAKSGLEYGENFANISKAHFAQNTCLSEIVIPDTAAIMPTAFQYPCVIHPCTLDSIIHSVFVTKRLTDVPAIPVYIEEMTVTQSFPSEPGTRVDVYTITKPAGREDIVASITAGTDGGPALSITGLRCKYVGDKASSTKEEVDQITYKMKWSPDIGLPSSDRLGQLLNKEDNDTPDTISNNLLEAHAVSYIHPVLERLDQSKIEDLIEPGRQLVKSFGHCIREQVPPNSAPCSETNTNAHTSHFSEPGAKLICTLGQRLPYLFTGEQLFPPDLREHSDWKKYWKSLYQTPVYQSAVSFLELLSHKNPFISVLELESGTGEASLAFIKSLMPSEDNMAKCSRFTLTGNNVDKIPLADGKAENLGDWVSFQQLNIEEPLDSQGVLKGSYDVVLVPYGLYTVKSVPDALVNIYALLRPGGHFIMINPLAGTRGLQNAMIFGTLPGASMKILEFCEKGFEAALAEAKLFQTAASVNSKDGFSMIVSKEILNPNVSYAEILIIAEDEDCGISISHLQDLLGLNHGSVEVTSIRDADPKGKLCLVLSELKNALLAYMDQAVMDAVKHMLQEASGVLWVTRGSAIHSTNPNTSLITGLARTARSETGVEPIVTLDLDAFNPLEPKQAAEVIYNLMKKVVLATAPGDLDSEYAERNGILLIPRVMEDNHSNALLASSRATYSRIEDCFHHPKRTLHATVDHTAKTDEIYFTQDNDPPGILDNQVRIDVHSIAISKFDQQSSSGPLCKGSGWAGMVNTVGKNVRDFAIGDRVACLKSEIISSRIQTRSTGLQKINLETSFEDAAAVSVVYCMAFYAAHYLAHIAPMETVVIYPAATALGQAATEICQLLGARVISVVEDEIQMHSLKTPTKDQFLLRNNRNLVKELKEMTDGKGVNVILNCHDEGTRVLQGLWKCTGTSSRVVQFCDSNSPSRSRWEIPNVEGVVFATVSQNTLWNLEPNFLDEIWAKVGDLLRDGKIHGPGVVPTYNISECSQALRNIRPNDQTESIVLTAGPGDKVKIIRPKERIPLFCQHASYLLVGGLGGIGRATALWMAENGAKNIIFINRSGLTRAASRDTVEELEGRGVRVFVRALDIADNQQVDATMTELAETAPQIRGVIQAAMVLKDKHIENMTLEDYHSVLQPKYTGTWNLHHYLPHDLDWFIMLSSISGIIGNATQAAYAAGSTFMDSFATYRNSLGLHAVSIDLGMITDAGYLAENTDLATRMAEQGFRGTNTKTVMLLIELAMTVCPHLDSSKPSQIITGLGTWKEGHSLPNFDTPLFSHFRRRFQTAIDANDTSSLNTLREGLKNVKSLDEASGLIYTALSAKIATHLSVPVESISPDNPVTEYGIDSHAAVELRNWILKRAESTVPILEILATGSMMELAMKIAMRSALVQVEE